jgi:4-hydroxy-tetrahydrodipicolinate synthase
MGIISKLRGTGVAIVTPFNKDFSVDFKSLSNLIEHLIKGKVEYIVVLGTTGETVTLNKSERQAVVDHVVKTVKKRIPVVLGLGGNNTLDLVEYCKDKNNFTGIDAVLSVSPYYNKPNQRGIYEHYKTLAANCPVPIILYNVPGRTGSNISADTTIQLAKEVKNIIAIKEASGNMEQCMKIIKNRPKDFLVISGDDLLTLPLAACGADGVISVVANAYPKEFSEMVRKSLAGKISEAQKLHYKLTDIIEKLFADGNPAGIKCVLNELGITKDYLRLPLVNVNKETKAAIQKLVKEL